MTVSITVNGMAAAPDSTGAYSVKPGDTVRITPNQAANWQNSSTSDGAVTLRSTAISTTEWQAQIVNSRTTPETLTVNAQATANASVSKDAVFKVAAGDSRNAQYRVFATNGSQLTLALNFDTQSYDMTDPQGVVATGAFGTDAGEEAGTYVFQSTRITSTRNNARFRFTGGAVIGAFPFTLPESTDKYAVQPFIAAKTFVTEQAGMDGFFYRLGLDMSSTTRNSQVRSIQIANGGTEVRLCNDVAITRPDQCTPANVMTYSVTKDAAVAGKWNIVNIARPTEKGAFYLALVDGQPVYLSAGTNTASISYPTVFRIGFPEHAWSTKSAYAVDTDGSWSRLTTDATTYTSGTIRSDGSTSNAAYGVSPVLLPGLQLINPTGLPRYFGMQSNKLIAVISPLGSSGGYLQLGTTD